jgi:hypothetical protein
MSDAFLSIMQSYFRGERVESLYFVVPAAIAMLVLAYVGLRIEKGEFGYALGIPLLIFGLVALGTGLSVGLRTPRQVQQLEQAYAASPATMVAAELPRMQKVNDNWPKYIAVWLVCVIAGLALRFLVSRDWAHGLGPALVFVGACGLLIDGFAERRARPYTAALSNLSLESGGAIVR